MIEQIVKNAGIELASNGMGVSTSARIYARNLWVSQGNELWGKARNPQVNDMIAKMFEVGEIKRKFKLKSGEPAEVRQSGPFFIVGAERRGSYDIIVIQGK